MKPGGNGPATGDRSLQVPEPHVNRCTRTALPSPSLGGAHVRGTNTCVLAQSLFDPESLTLARVPESLRALGRATVSGLL